MDTLDRSQKWIAIVGAVIGIFGMVLGAGIGYQALKSQVDGQQVQINKLEKRVDDNEVMFAQKLDAIEKGINGIEKVLVKLEERIGERKQ